MATFTNMLEDVASSKDYTSNARCMQYIGNVLKNAKKTPSKTDLDELKSFTISEMLKLIGAISNAKNYREKDDMFFYEDGLLMVFTLANYGMENISKENITVIRKLVELVNRERSLENAIDELFNCRTIKLEDLKKVFDIVNQITDEYRRSLLYQGLHNYCNKIKLFDEEAKNALAELVYFDGLRLLADEVDNDKLLSLEFIADITKYFLTDKLIELLQRILETNFNRMRYYAIVTLLENNCEVSKKAICEMAEDTEFACMVYTSLNKNNKLDLYPQEYSSPEYLALSNMVQWLCYPTELGKKPDKIELLGCSTVKKEKFYIFKYMSDSDNLPDEDKNVWLIGWSSDEGGTFSNFDRLDDFEQKTLEKTIKFITKKLLK